MGNAVAATGTDRERLDRVLAALAAEGVAVWFDLRGTRGSISGRLDDYQRAADIAGTDRWVGDHIGDRDRGGAYWDNDGVLRTNPNGTAWAQLQWSFNHELPELADLLVRLFTEQGFDAYWPGEYSCVIVPLAGAR